MLKGKNKFKDIKFSFATLKKKKKILYYENRFYDFYLLFIEEKNDQIIKNLDNNRKMEIYLKKITFEAKLKGKKNEFYQIMLIIYEELKTSLQLLSDPYYENVFKITLINFIKHTSITDGFEVDERKMNIKRVFEIILDEVYNELEYFDQALSKKIMLIFENWRKILKD